MHGLHRHRVGTTSHLDTVWTEGYPAGSAYEHGYFHELNPVFIDFALTSAGFAAPGISSACELGYGHGVSLAVHQAASGADWWGTDFMPAQAHHAQTLAGAAAALHDQSFAAFCGRGDLPDFDLIVAHGVWSWVSAENRAVIADFVRRKLRPGGVFFVSYNSDAGLAGLRPLRHMLLQQVRCGTAPSTDRLAALRGAVRMAEDVLGARSAYAAQNPGVVPLLAHIGETLSDYHVHEYLGDHWNPMDFAEVAHELHAAKLTFACSASLLDRVPALALLEEHRAALSGIADPVLHEMVRDMLLATRFRRDYWVKGPRRLSASEQADLLGRCRVVLTEPPDAVSQVCPHTAAGQLSLPLGMFAPVIEALSDHRPHRIDDLTTRLGRRGLKADDVRQAVMVLCDVGALRPAHASDHTVDSVLADVAALNARILDRSPHDGTLGHLACPVTGGGHEVPRLQQLLLFAEANGGTAADQMRMIAGKTGLAPEDVGQAAEDFGAGRRRVLAAMHIA